MRHRQASIGRMLHLAGVFALALLCSACVSSTAPGTIGVNRQQFFMVPSELMDRQSAQFYMQLSRAAYSQGKFNNDPALTARVRAIGYRLIREVPVFRPDAAKWAWEINVFDSDQLNAFCASGGKIGFFSGLIRRLDLNDAEIAAVMGHEIAHALREHMREKTSQQVLSHAVVQGIASSNSRNAAVASALTNVGANLLLHLPFSREMETEADLMGLELMARAGYDPRYAANVWRKMQRMGQDKPAEFLSTHPSDDRRIQTLEREVPKVWPVYEKAARVLR
jgi:predicted Zn-dependent protease